MPYTVAQLEPGIQLMTWTDHISEDEFRQSVYDRVQLANSQGDYRYVTIMNLSSVAVRSTNIRLAKWAVRFDARLKHVIVVQPSTSVAIIVNLVAKMMLLPYATASSVDEALKQARRFISGESATT